MESLTYLCFTGYFQIFVSPETFWLKDFNLVLRSACCFNKKKQTRPTCSPNRTLASSNSKFISICFCCHGVGQFVQMFFMDFLVTDKT